MIIKRKNNINSFPKDFFEDSSNSSKKYHPKIINPANTIKIVPSNINEIKEEKIEESVENSQLKINNLKIIIPDNSNEEIEPSTSGSKLSQNTPSNSPLIIIDKNKFQNEENKIISLNKDDKNIIKDDELFKVTPHFPDDNKTSCESLNIDSSLKNPITPTTNNTNKIKTPLTCENKGYFNSKFNFDFETKENGVIIPKNNSIKENKIKKSLNIFRMGNNNKNSILNMNKQNYSNNKLNFQNDNKCEIINNSHINSSLVSLKYNTNHTSPMKPLKNNKNYKNDKNIPNKNKLINDNNHNSLRSNQRRIFIDNQEKKRTHRPYSVKNISPKKNTYNINCMTNNEKKCKNNNININQRKKYSKSINKNAILPKLAGNKISNMKNQIEAEISNLIEILPYNYEEFPEIKNNLGKIFQNINDLKEYINKTTQTSFRHNKTKEKSN